MKKKISFSFVFLFLMIFSFLMIGKSSDFSCKNVFAYTETLEGGVTKINFDNYTFSSENSIELTGSNYEISGTVSSTKQAPVFIINPSQNDAVITFKNLSITNNNYQNLIEFANSSKSAQISFFDCTFNSTHQNSMAIKFDSSNYSVSLGGNNTCLCNYFLNFVNGLSISIDEELTNTTPLKILINYDVDGEEIVSNYVGSSKSKLSFLCYSNFYELEQFIMNNTLILTAKILINFDANTASFNQNYTVPTKFVYNSSLNFPTIENMTKEHYTFCGWFGKYEFNSQTYYFDKTCLESFASSGFDEQMIPTIFKTNTDDFVIQNSFSKYEFDSLKSSSNFNSIYAFIFNQKQPSFVSKWKINSHTITFDSNDGSTVESITKNYNEAITKPTNPTKTGSTFLGWFTDDETFLNEFEFNLMPDADVELFAKWQKIDYTIAFDSKGGSSVESITKNYNETITKPTNPTKTGYSFVGWFTDNISYQNEFTFSTMPAESFTLYAKWSINSYDINFFSNGGNDVTKLTLDYNSIIPTLEKPIKTGYTFAHWCTDSNLSTKFSLTKMPAENLNLYAKWTPKTFVITLKLNNNLEKQNLNVDYDSPINIETPIKKNNTFDGWFFDEELTTPLNLTKMPAENLTVYAKWTPKQTIDLEFKNQSTNYGELDSKYSIASNLENFEISYYVDGKWTNVAPTDAGEYDVKIFRAEDSTYAEYSNILKSGYTVSPLPLNYYWLIIVLFVLGFFEIGAVVIMRVLKKMKAGIIYSLPLVFGNYFLPNTQFALLIVSATLSIVGFILFICEFVKIRKTVPNFEKELENKNVAILTAIQEKTNFEEKMQGNVSKYSAEDVETLLQVDNYKSRFSAKTYSNLKEKREREETSPTHANKSVIHDDVIVVDDDEFHNEEIKNTKDN